MLSGQSLLGVMSCFMTSIKHVVLQQLLQSANICDDF